MRDFTITIYERLLDALIGQGYTFQTLEEFLRSPSEKTIILRHDVDLLPGNSLKFAEIQSKRNIKGVYYFRAVPESWDENIIMSISKLGHEIGYHYESLTTTNGDVRKGIIDFKTNLEELRKLAPVSTICMHGSPRSKFDSRDLWKENNYKDFGLMGEPYFDLDFNEVFYLTDTGRKWDGDKVSVRDKVNSGFDLSFHSTEEIISVVRSGKFPKQVMFTFHPQRWNDGVSMWLKEYIFQSVKNIVKQLFYVKKNEG